MNHAHDDPSASMARPPLDDAVSERIAALLWERGIVNQAQLRYACRVYGKLRGDYTLIKVLQELGYLHARPPRERTAAGQRSVADQHV